MEEQLPNMFTITMLVASMIAAPVLIWFKLVKNKHKPETKKEPTPSG